jgi:hypothetical protein
MNMKNLREIIIRTTKLPREGAINCVRPMYPSVLWFQTVLTGFAGRENCGAEPVPEAGALR